MDEERVNELLLHVALGAELRNVRGRHLDARNIFKLGNQAGKLPFRERY